jgi:hypothetical protein
LESITTAKAQLLAKFERKIFSNSNSAAICFKILPKYQCLFKIDNFSTKGWQIEFELVTSLDQLFETSLKMWFIVWLF